jgi:hypothetical protein
MLQKISQISTDLFTSWGKGHTGFFHSSLVLANCHIETNHFTPYNDAYGFSRGDEVIDFVFIVPLKHAELFAKSLLRISTSLCLTLSGKRKMQDGTMSRWVGEE